MKYKTVGDVLEAISTYEQPVSAADVPRRLYSAKIWVSGSGFPGCLYDYGPNYSRSKRDAIADLCWCADDSETGVPHGMKSALQHYGNFTDSRGIRYEVSRDTLSIVLC